MRTSQLLWLGALSILGCSIDRTIADEGTSSQGVSITARPICLQMCDHALSCGEFPDAQYSNCATQCELDSRKLEAAVTNATVQLEGIASCYLANQCARDATPPACDRAAIAGIAGQSRLDQPVLSSPSIGSKTVMEWTSCAIDPDNPLLACETSIKPQSSSIDWTQACERPDPASDWTCRCFKGDTETVARDPTATTAVGYDLEYCWTSSELNCFTAGGQDC